MRPHSSNWLKEIELFRNRLTDDSYSIPTYPWLAPPLHPELRSLIERWGVETELAPHDPVLGRQNDKVDKLVLIKSGITARCFGSIHGIQRPAVAFSIPGRLACGNLNFFTHRPCIGSYFALVPSVVISIPQSLLYSLCEKDPKMLMLVAREFELINLSDRLGFGVHASLGVVDRLLAYFITWAVAFGHEEEIDGVSWIRIPAPLRGEALQYVVNCSPAALERALSSLKSAGNFVQQSDSALIKLECLLPVHRWLRNIEERSSELYRKPLRNILSDDVPPH